MNTYTVIMRRDTYRFTTWIDSKSTTSAIRRLEQEHRGFKVDSIRIK